jgi:hypothetical protein
MRASFDSAAAEGVMIYSEADVLVQLSFTGVNRADMEAIVAGLQLGTADEYEAAVRAH